MDKTQELEVVKTACAFEYMISKMEEEIKKLDSEKPKKPPKPREPREQSSNVNLIPYPAINPPHIAPPPFWIRGVVIMVICIAATVFFLFFSVVMPNLSFLYVFAMLGIIVGFFCLVIDGFKSFLKKDKLRQQSIEKIRNSPEYQMQCRQIDEQNRMRQEQLDRENREKYVQKYEQYRADCREYEIVLKDYEENRLAVWSAEIADLNDKINYTRNALQEVYDKNVIPIPYCNLQALTYLAMFLQTSEYDLKYAIERYDSYVNQTLLQEHNDIARAQLRMQREILQNQQYTNSLNEQLVSFLEGSGFGLQSNNSGGYSGGFLRTITDGVREKYRTVDLLGSAHCAKARGKDCRDCTLRYKCTRGGVFNHLLR